MRGNFNSRKPFITRKCLACGKEFLYSGSASKKYCDNVCQNVYQNTHGTRTKAIPYPKEFFERLYLQEKLSLGQIAKKLNTNLKKVHRWLIRYDIPTRSFSTKGIEGYWAKGIPKSIETREKIAAGRRGEKSWMWKGGVTSFHKKIRQGYELKLWRKAVLKRDNKTCQMCGIRKEKGMEVDHIKPFCDYPEFRTSIENGRTLCNLCHRTTDTYGGRSKKNINKLT